MSLRRVLELFDQIVDLPLAEQGAALSRAAGGDASLIAQVQEMLVADRQEQEGDGFLLPVPDGLFQGAEVGRYVVEHRLGEGGMAEVWCVRHRLLGRRWALKVLTQADEPLRQRLLREGRTQATLSHPNLLPVHDILDVFGQLGLLMPLVEGPSLARLLARYRPTPAEARGLLLGTCDGLQHAHAEGFVHRDLKPGNVLLSPRPGGVVPRIADFGLVKADDALQTRAGTVFGTPAYAAPEQLRDAASAGPPADVFSLGVMLVELFTGEMPFPGERLHEVQAAHRAPPQLGGLSGALRALAARMLSRDPALRPRVSAVRDALSALALPGGAGGLAQAVSAEAEQPSSATIAPSSWERARHNLPPLRGIFVGQAGALAAIDAAFAAGARLVTVLGAPGSGKSTLIVQAGRQGLSRWPGGVWRAEQPDAHRALAMGRALLILDDVSAADAPAIAARLSRSPQLCFLAAAAEPLGLPGEELISLGALDAESAMALFEAEAVAADHRFSAAAHRDEIQALLALLGNHPGDIVKAAQRCRLMTPADLLRRYQRRRR